MWCYEQRARSAGGRRAGAHEIAKSARPRHDRRTPTHKLSLRNSPSAMLYRLLLALCVAAAAAKPGGDKPGGDAKAKCGELAQAAFACLDAASAMTVYLALYLPPTRSTTARPSASRPTGSSARRTRAR